jgi:tetratricopeptide (TPR) repeat protein
MTEGSRRGIVRSPALAALFLFLALLAGRILTCPDLGWHVRAGQRIVEERAIPTTDTFTYTVAGNHWWVNQPLAETVFYAVHESVGPVGLILLNLAVVGTMFAFVLRAGRLSGARNEFVAAAVLLLAMLASASHMLVRPNTISALLLAVTAWGAERERRGAPMRPWVLPALFAVWAQVHPGFLFGAAVLACYAAGEAARRIFPYLRGDVPLLGWKGVLRLSRTALLSVAAALASGALLNPSGISAILLPIGLMKTGYFFRVLDEFQPAGILRDRFFAALFLVALISVLPKRRRDATEILQLAIFGAFALRAVRVIQPFAVVAAPIAMRNLAFLGERFLPDRSRSGRYARALTTALVGLLAFWWWENDPYRIPTPLQRKALGDAWAWGRANYPVRAFRFIEREGLPGEVYHPDCYGGPFIWYFYPERKNFVDGRVEVFGERFWRETYARIASCGPGWEDLLDQYRVNTLLLTIPAPGAGDPMGERVPALRDWALVYFDDEVMVYVRRGARDPEILGRLELAGVDPARGASPASREEEVLARAGIHRSLEAGVSQRALLYLMDLMAAREEWSAMSEASDAILALRGNPALRRSLHRLRGEARFRAGDWKGALEDWRKAGSGLEARDNILLFKYLQDGRTDRLGARAPRREDELARLAALLGGAREFEGAATLLREAVLLGGRPEHRNALSWTLLEGDLKPGEALREAEEAVRAAPGDGYARGTLALARARSGDRVGAEREMREAIRLLPPEDYRVGASVRGRLALHLAASGDAASRDEALRWAEDALRMDSATEEREALGRVLARAGRIRELARLARAEGELLNQASLIEGTAPVPDRCRTLFVGTLRDLGYGWDDAERLADAYAPREKAGSAGGGGSAAGR